MPHAWFTSPGRTGAVVAAGALAALVYSYARRPAPKIAVARGRPSTTPRTEARPDHPYPYDVFPGGRDVATPYGTIRVYEFGPESGAKVLLMHGIGTPCVALGDMARQFVRRGCRVMLFDFFGRGYSDGPVDLPYDERLYLTQTLLVLSSSPLSWTGDDAVHVVGYSLGGAVAAALAAWYPRLVRSATLVCPGGLIRAEHVSLRSRVVYSDALGGWWQHRYIRSRLEPGPPGAEVAMADDVDEVRYEAFDDVPLSRGALGGPVVGDAMRWQLQTNDALPHAYVSTLANAPVYAQHDGLWARLAERLAERREGGGDGLPGLRGGRVCLVLADEDPVVVMEEWLQDASEVLGEEGVDVHVVKGGHEIAITKGAAIADIAIESWEAGGKA